MNHCSVDLTRYSSVQCVMYFAVLFGFFASLCSTVLHTEPKTIEYVKTSVCSW